MTWAEIISAVLLTLGAGGGGVAAMKFKRDRSPHSKREKQLLEQLKCVQLELEKRRASDHPGPRRSEQIPEWMRDTWTKERAEKEAAEAAVAAADIADRRDSRERVNALERANSNNVVQLGRIDYRLSAIEAATKENGALLGSVRDAVLMLRARCPQCDDSDNGHVVRGGAAVGH